MMMMDWLTSEDQFPMSGCSNNVLKGIEANQIGFSFSDGPTLEDIRQLHSEFSDERNWGQFHSPRNILLALIAEVGELAELFQYRTNDKWTNDMDKLSLKQELSDVLIYLVRLADRCKIDLAKAACDRLGLKAQTTSKDKENFVQRFGRESSSKRKKYEREFLLSLQDCDAATRFPNTFFSTEFRAHDIVIPRMKTLKQVESEQVKEEKKRIRKRKQKQQSNENVKKNPNDKLVIENDNLKNDLKIANDNQTNANDNRTNANETQKNASDKVKSDKQCKSKDSFSFIQNSSLNDIREAALKNRIQNCDNAKPVNHVLGLVKHVGKVAEIFQWKGEVSVGLDGWNVSDKDKLRNGLTDVLLNLILLADKCKVNLPKDALSKLQFNKFKYPVEKAYGSSKKYNEYSPEKKTETISVDDSLISF